MKIEEGMWIPRSNPNPISDFHYVLYRKESGWQATIRGWFVPKGLETGWEFYHTWDSRKSDAGFPDVVAVHAIAGITLYAELKTETGTVSEDQARWLNALADAGNEVYLWRPSDELEVRDILDTVDSVMETIRFEKGR